MDEGRQDGGAPADRSKGSGGDSRPQQAGEAATTRFGMEEGDNTDVPATGQGLLEEEDEADEEDPLEDDSE